MLRRAVRRAAVSAAGRTLLADPNEGIERFNRCVSDIRLFFHTYSYSGN